MNSPKHPFSLKVRLAHTKGTIVIKHLSARPLYYIGICRVSPPHELFGFYHLLASISPYFNLSFHNFSHYLIEFRYSDFEISVLEKEKKFNFFGEGDEERSVSVS